MTIELYGSLWFNTTIKFGVWRILMKQQYLKEGCHMFISLGLEEYGRGGGRERSTIWLKPVIFMLLHLFHERRIKNWGADGSQFYLFRLIMKLTIYSRGITPLSLMDDINIYPLSKSQCLSQYYTPVIFGVNRSWKLQFSL